MGRSAARTAGLLLCVFHSFHATGCTDVPEPGTGGAGSSSSSQVSVTTGSASSSTSASATTSATTATSSSSGGECSGAADGQACTGGLCCAGTCTVVDSNPDHCGACNRKCGGDSPSCSGSACAAEILETYTSAAAVNDLFVDPDDSHVYWTVYGGSDPNAGGVYRLNLSNDAEETLFANTPQFASVAVQGAQLLLTIAVNTSASGVYKCPKDACSTLTPFGTPLPYYPQGTPHLAVTPTQVAGQYYPSSVQQSFRCNAATCANQSGVDGPHWVAADSTYMYRSSQDAAVLETFAQNNLNATAVVYKTLSPGASPRQMHVGDDGHLYWYELGNQSIMRSTLGQVAGAVETVATGVDNNEFDMVERDGTLYWIDSGASGWVLEACTASNCMTTRRVIGDVLEKPRVMAVSSKYVFVGTRVMGTQPPSYLERFPR